MGTSRPPDYVTSRNNRGGSISGTLRDATGAAVEIADGSDLTFIMRQVGGAEPVVSASAVIVDGPQGQWRYDWADDDLAQEGDYYGEIQVISPDDTVETTYPDGPKILIRVYPDLG